MNKSCLRCKRSKRSNYNQLNPKEIRFIKNGYKIMTYHELENELNLMPGSMNLIIAKMRRMVGVNNMPLKKGY